MHKNEILYHIAKKIEKMRQKLNRKGKINLHDHETYKISCEMDRLILTFLKVKMNLEDNVNEVPRNFKPSNP